MGKLGEILTHPEELLPLIRMYHASKKAARLPQDPDLAFCYDLLTKVSRSFAIVIQQLPNPLRDAICVFYLVLRGLDTVEDDMSLSDDVKLPVLRAFQEKIYDRKFTMDCGAHHYKYLMANFGTVVNVFLSLEVPFQDVIAEITQRMGDGMAEFIEKEVKTVDEYDKYCHYVAGLVGIGLSKLFATSGLESPHLAEPGLESLANHMGLFLQKTNIIRDYLEDIMEEPAPRMFWPKAIWGLYADQLEDFKHPENRAQAVQCLNHMITNALHHLPYCIQYMQKLKNPMVFRFCAIPQIMALGTLAVCYNNGKLFEGVVKMRRGQTATVFDSTSGLRDTLIWFIQFLDVLDHKTAHEVASQDPTLGDATSHVAEYKALCYKLLNGMPAPSSSSAWLRDYLLLLVSGIYTFYIFGMGSQPVPPVVKQYLLSGTQQQLMIQQVLAAILLIVAMRMVVFTKR